MLKLVSGGELEAEFASVPTGILFALKLLKVSKRCTSGKESW